MSKRSNIVDKIANHFAQGGDPNKTPWVPPHHGRALSQIFSDRDRGHFNATGSVPPNVRKAILAHA